MKHTNMDHSVWNQAGQELGLVMVRGECSCAPGKAAEDCRSPKSARTFATNFYMGLLFALGALMAQGADRTLVQWAFDRAGDLEGWQPNRQVTDVRVSNGVLSCRAIGADPILELQPQMDLAASPWQVLEVRLKAERDGIGEFFWSNTTEGPYGGFSQSKSTRFNVSGDNHWHTYRLMPFWQAEGKIIRLRFDVYDGATFAVDCIRIVQLAMAPLAEPAEFDFSRGNAGWRFVGKEGAIGGSKSGDAEEGSTEGMDFALSPPLEINAEEQSFVSLRLAVDQGSHATLFFATETSHGLHRLSFPITAGGQERIYNLDMLAAPGWHGRVLALGLRPSDVAGAKARLQWLKTSDAPQGPPQVRVVSFALEDALPRAGVPASLSALVSNAGGETAMNLRAKVVLPAGMQVLEAAPSDSRVATLGFGEEARLSWRVRSGAPMCREAVLELAMANAETLTARAPLVFTSRLNILKSDYVPEPKPVRGEYEVGAYYFPGWKSASQWAPIRRFPERKPVLGWYREGSPEVADWHIKWAVEHGITFFAYDWYWSQGARQLEHALHEGYFKARYRHLLKFCLLWANHNPPRTSSRADCEAVTRYWIENYFRRPEHLSLEGKPVVIIFSPQRLTDDLGSPKVKSAFDSMRAECQRAGLKGLYLIACVGDTGGARTAAAEGYDAITAYNWPGVGRNDDELYAPFESLIEGYRRNWHHLLEQASVPLVLPLSGGWDSRPWLGEANLVRFGRTPGLFQRHLGEAKCLLELEPGESKMQKIVLIEAWNEWGEGSYIEPHKEFGFGYLEAIRTVFTEAPKDHADVTPADAGLGPYDVPPPAAFQCAWEFTQDDEGWNSTMGLTHLGVRDGALTGRTTGVDPAFFGPPAQVRASEFSTVRVRMRLRREDGQSFRDTAHLFWRTARLAESEATRAGFEVNGDGQWHEYVIPVAPNRRWRGLITRLRLDPCNQPGVQVGVDFIRLMGHRADPAD